MSAHGWPYRLWSCRCTGGGGSSGPAAPPEAAGGIATWRQCWREVQTELLRHGFDPGPIDGVRGPRTDDALVRFKTSRGLRARAYVGELTVNALLGERMTSPTAPPPGPAHEPRWLSIARTYLGLAEINGPHHHPEILSWWRDLGATWFNDDETPWCGAFVGGVLVEAGIAIPSAAEAPRTRAWAEWGRPVDGPALGAIVVLWRGAPNSASGHVGFVAGRDAAGRLLVLGGNQSDAVTVAAFDPDRVVANGFRWPQGEPPPPRTGSAGLPIPPAVGAKVAPSLS